MHTSPFPLRLTLLVVDNDALYCRIVSAMLARRGHVIRTAYSGSDAVAELVRGGVDVVVARVSMPGMGGAAIAAAIRGSETAAVDATIPLIGLAGVVEDSGVVAACLNAGMDAVVDRPVRIAQLLDAVREAMLRRGRPVWAERLEDAAHPMESTLRSAAEVQAEFGLEAADLETLYAMLRNSLPDEVTRLSLAVEQGRLDDAAGLAHSLAGSALGIVTEGLALLAREVEHAARYGDAEEAVRLCTELVPQVRQLCDRLQMPPR